MSQWLRAQATKPDDLSLTLSTHTVEGENQLPKLVLWSPCGCCGMDMFSSAITNNVVLKIK